MEAGNGEKDRALSTRKAAKSGDVLNEGEVPAKRDVFSENYEAAFAIGGDDFPVRIHQVTTIEPIGFHAAIGAHPRLRFIATQDEPYFIGVDQLDDRAVDILIELVAEFENIRHGRFRP